MLHEMHVLQYYMLTLTGTVPKAISKSVFYAPAPLRATATPLLSPRPHLRLPAVTVKPSTAIHTQVLSKSCNLIIMDVANIDQALR